MTEGGVLRQHGEKYAGFGKNFCNRCKCHNGQQICTERDCGVSDKKECSTTRCTYGVRFADVVGVMKLKDAEALYGDGLPGKKYEMATLVQHSVKDKNGDRFTCGVTDHTKRLTDDVQCKCYCSFTGKQMIWHHEDRHQDEIKLGLTSARCKCKDSWTFRGRKFSGCANPKVAGIPLPEGDHTTERGGWADDHGQAPHNWCKVETNSCQPGRVPAGADWDTCEDTAHFKFHVGPLPGSAEPYPGPLPGL